MAYVSFVSFFFHDRTCMGYLTAHLAFSGAAGAPWSRATTLICSQARTASGPLRADARQRRGRTGPILTRRM